MRLLSVALTFAKVATQQQLAYRGEFAGVFINAFAVDTLNAAVSVAVIYAHTDSLRGWSAGEMLVVVGMFNVVLGVMSTIMFPSLNRTAEDVYEGTFDYVLMKPVPSLFFASTHQVQVGHLVNSIMGVVLCAVGLFILEAGELSWRVALFPLMLASALAIFYAFVVAMTTLVFWAVRLEGIESMFNVFFRTARYPVDIYPTWIRGFLTYMFPVAFVSTVPTETLVGRDSGWLIAVGPVIAALAVYGATRFWRLGLRRYSSASS